MSTFRYWQTARAGNMARLTLHTGMLRTLANNHVRIKVHAVGLNFADIFALTGLYSATPQGAFIPGLEFAGEVEEVSPEAERFAVGDRVMGVTRFGGYTSVIDSEPEYLIPLPADWDYAQGAAWPAQTLTAWYALTHLGALQADQQVLIHSAAGGVGLQAMKLVQALGGRATGTVGSEEKATWLGQQGFEDVLVRAPDFARQLQRHDRHFDLYWMPSAARFRPPASTRSTPWAAWWSSAPPNSPPAKTAPTT
jgi:alcohol dehydrogenase